MNIKILGTGCLKCKLLEEHVRKAVESLGVSATIEKVTDIKKIIDYGVMATPGLVIDEKVVSTGRVLSKEEIVTKIMNAKLEEEK
ncbi:MAG: thioredoxin family protein [Caldisericia bacterium]|nr:thioredoxin family protein [Caldisericia bacterium]MDD5689002.1 thioredoxin family protein [Caldisericia bacterium]